jgi:hypothetical protein
MQERTGGFSDMKEKVFIFNLSLEVMQKITDTIKKYERIETRLTNTHPKGSKQLIWIWLKNKEANELAQDLKTNFKDIKVEVKAPRKVYVFNRVNPIKLLIGKESKKGSFDELKESLEETR